MGNRALIEQLKQNIQAIESGATETSRFNGTVEHRNAEADSADALQFDCEPTRQPLATSKRAKSMPTDGEDPERKSAFSRIVAWANARDRSQSSVRQRLKKEGYEEPEIDDAVTRALDYGIIDDLRYADVLIRSRLAQGKGAAGIERELEGEGISAYDVEGWPYAYGVSDESEFQRALDVLEKNPSRSKNKREGAYRKLIGKGFSSSVASSAARTWSER